jgi:transposase
VAALDPAKLVFVDESGINTSMTRTRGRAAVGERVIGVVPQGHWKTLTMIGAVRLKGMAAAVTVDAATDTDVFGTFVHEALVPALHPGDVVLWDGLAPHKAQQMRQEVEQARATLIPLPPYSPDLSPIEPAWSKVKGHVRDVEPRTSQALGHAAEEGFASITAADARGWFKKCGYCVQ